MGAGVSTDYRGYLAAIEELAMLSDRTAQRRDAVEREAQQLLAGVDREWKNADAELRSLDDGRNRMQREVTALCRDVGVRADQTASGVGTFGSVREIDVKLVEVGREVERARRDWQWAQRHRARANSAPPPPPTPAPTVIAPIRSVAPEPEPNGASSRMLVIGLGVALVVIVVLILALVL